MDDATFAGGGFRIDHGVIDGTGRFILSGTPGAAQRRVRRDGTLADGKVTARSGQ